MAMKSYGRIKVTDKEIIIQKCEPHVSIKLKAIFHRIPKGSICPYTLPLTDDMCRDIIWFMVCYPFTIGSQAELERLYAGNTRFLKQQRKVEEILQSNYKPGTVKLTGAITPRNYQVLGNDMMNVVKRLLIADDIGIGKSITSILGMLEPGTLPAVVVMQTHMQKQWKGYIESNTNLKTFAITKTTPYPLPRADVYLFRYSQLAGWVNEFEKGMFKYAIFDEVQEMRHEGTQKYNGGKVLSNSCHRVAGLSATPIYNYGDEIFNVLDLIKEGCLGPRDSFIREWCTEMSMNKWKVDDPDALGAYLREANLILRRTRKDVGRELPPINTIIQPVEYDENMVASSRNIAKTLAQRILDPSVNWRERGEAGLAFDLLIRKDTGVSKAIHVAAFIRMLVENGESVLVGAWHREVYEILNWELKDLNPVMYTGSESVTQKEEAKRKFCNRESKIMLMSLRSGAGIDGIQHVCDTAVMAELDHSPKVHEQFIGRIDRDRGGKQKQVTAFYMVSDYGSDPPMVETLGIKSAQSHGILNPGQQAKAQHTDESRLKQIAQWFLNSNK